jgi:autonomous glycyl radical cofactor GrcA
MKKTKPPREETIVGYVVPSEWDSEDNVVSISITTDDDDYVVEMNKLGEELFDFLDEDVEVTGTVREDKDGTKRIRVISYEVLEDAEDEYDDEEFSYDDEDDEEE